MSAVAYTLDCTFQKICGINGYLVYVYFQDQLLMRVATKMPTNFSQLKPKAALDMILAASLLFSLTGCSQGYASFKGLINGTAEGAGGSQIEGPVTNGIKTNGTVASSTSNDLGLNNTYWKLTTLGDNAVVRGAEQQELYMVLSSDETKVTGFSGCNRFAGNYALLQAQISFEQLLLTRKTCFQNMGLEHQFLAVLAETEYYAVNDAALILYNNDGSVLAQFASRYLQ
ncbi:MAG: heat shock protein HslJ [Moritella sp.]